MRLFVKLAAAAVLMLALQGQARADVPPQPTTTVDQRLQSLGQWTSSIQNIINAMVGVMQSVPDAPLETMSRAERRAWAENARTWAAEAEITFADLRQRAAQLPTSPPSDSPITPELRTALEQTRLRLPAMVDAANEISRGFPALADAFERRQDDAVRQMRVQGIDAVVLTISMMHDINITQALAMPPENPQRYLLLSYAHSYEGFDALLRFKRQVMLTGQSSVDAESAAAAAINTAVSHTREDIIQGRQAQQTVRGMIATIPRSNAENVATIDFMTQMLATYDSSFEREFQGLAELEAIAAILQQPGDFAAREPTLDDHMTRYGEFDSGRVQDAQRRQQIMLRR